MKRLIIILFLSGCYSAKENCHYGMVRLCNGNEYSEVARYQKPYSLGKTNSIQHWADVENCGGYHANKHLSTREERMADSARTGTPIGFYPTIPALIIKGEKNKDGSWNFPVIRAFENCMKKRIYLSVKCGMW